MKAGLHPVQVTHPSQVQLHSHHYQWEERSVPWENSQRRRSEKKNKAILCNKNDFQACPIVTSVFGRQLDSRLISLCR